MRIYRLGIVSALTAAVALWGGCQLVSGLDDLEARNAAGAVSAGVGGGAGGGVGGEAGAGGGAGGGGNGGGGAGGGGSYPIAEGCQVQPAQCPVILIENTSVKVDMVAVDDQFIYWANRGGPGDPPSGQIWRANLDGSNAVLLVDKVNPYDLAVDKTDDLLFWTDNRLMAAGQIRAGSIMGGNGDGGTLVISIVQPTEVIALGTSQQYLFYTVAASQLISRAVSLTMSAGPEDIYKMLSTAPIEMDVEGETLYWSEANAIRRMGDAGGTYMLLPSIMINDAIYGIDAEKGKVFAALRGLTHTITSIDEGTLAQTVEVTETNPTYVHSDGVRLYWTGSTAPNCNLGQISYVRGKPLGEVGKDVLLAVGLLCPTNFVKNDKFVYWGAGLRIYRVPRGS